MLLIGSPGAGKSTLTKTWMAGLEPKRFLPLLITQSSLTATGLLEVLLAKLGERARFKRSTNLLLLEKHLTDLDPATLVLILDDAQNYPAPALEELRLLLGVGGGRRSVFALVLLGDEYLLGSLRLSIQHAVDLLAEASEGNPRTLGLLAQAAWLAAARQNVFTIEADHVHADLRQVPSTSAKIPQS